MIDERSIEEAIRKEANKHIERFQRYHNTLHNEWLRAEKRTGKRVKKVIHQPDYWLQDKKFNPFYCRAHAKAIARSMAKKIAGRKYSPRTPFTKRVPKLSGGSRKVTIFQIPDAALSKLLYERLLSKNRHRFSSFSYAYRDDRNVHFAIQDIFTDLENQYRSFVAEFDFSDFFGQIDHDFLLGELHKHGLLLGEEDLFLVRSFLETQGKGIPQGTSISLFLANVACLQIDRDLERLGVKFARYADDTVITSNSYETVCRAADKLAEFSRRSGVPLNLEKSHGVRLVIARGVKPEFKSSYSFDFLGYSVGPDGLSIKAASLRRIKKEISYLLYRDLVQPLRSSTLRGITIPSGGKDEALLTAMLRVRRYVCGGLLNGPLRTYARVGRGRLSFKGVMSFYPLITDVSQLEALDGWLVSTIFRVIKLREKLLMAHGYTRGSMFPFNVNQDDVVRRFRAQKINGKKLLEVPSFVFVQQAMSRALREHGIHYVMNSRSNSYTYAST